MKNEFKIGHKIYYMEIKNVYVFIDFLLRYQFNNYYQQKFDDGKPKVNIKMKI